MSILIFNGVSATHLMAALYSSTDINNSTCLHLLHLVIIYLTVVLITNSIQCPVRVDHDCGNKSSNLVTFLRASKVTQSLSYLFEIHKSIFTEEFLLNQSKCTQPKRYKSFLHERITSGSCFETTNHKNL